MPAFVFPGQGSQCPGMGQAWVHHPSWEIVDDASEAAGRDLSRLLLDAGPEELTETRNAQLVTFTLSLVILDAVERLGIEPTACAGHSVGEYTALVAAGALGFEDGVKVVAERGEAMQSAADAKLGVMMTVDGLDDERVDVACRRADGDVWLANYNGPQELVIAGAHPAIDRAVALARRWGARAVRPVTVGGAFHTPYMAAARDRLRKSLASTTFREPEVPVVANVDALPHATAQEWDQLLSAQLCNPVRWYQSVLRLEDAQETDHLFVELGPGGVLSGMIRRIAPQASTLAVSSPDDLDVLVDNLAGNSALHAFAAAHHGARLYVSERVVISPGVGTFSPIGDFEADTLVEVGTLLGSVSGVEVRSPFRGQLMGMLAHPGERVQIGQPIAWLRAT